MAFHKAVKEQSKLRLALCGLAGAGKTFSAISIASAMSKLIRDSGHGEGRIAVIDSERKSASLYADKFDFDVAELESFSPLNYAEQIKEAEAAGYDIIVVDSLSHAWAGKDGALDQKDQASDRGGNSWTAWRTVTPKHNALVDALVGSKSHVIATMRTKMEYVQETNNGKTEIKKVGLAAIQREGMEYEFTLVGDIDMTHAMRISKTRCDGAINIGDLFEKPGEHFAKKVYGWLTSGAAPSRPTSTPAPAPTPETVAFVASMAKPEIEIVLDAAFATYLADMKAAKDLASLDRAATGPSKPAKGTPSHKLATDTYVACKDALIKAAQQPQAVAS